MGRMVYRGGAPGNMGGIPGGDIGKAKFALQNNRPDEAERLCRKRLERRPDDSTTRLLLAQALLQLQRTDEALTEVRRVTREQPANADAFLILSAALTQKQNPRLYPDAEEAARRAVTLQPKQARGRVQLAEVLLARNNLKDARTEADAAVQLEPRLAPAHLIRGLILLSDKDPEAAVTSLESAVRYDGSLFAGHFALSNALMEVRRYDDALTALNRAQQLNPMLPANNFEAQRGRIYLKQRQFGPAYRQFVRARRAGGRLAALAPVLGVLDLSQFFGRYAPAVVLLILVAAILFGLGFIPVVGPWIVVVVLLALLGSSFILSLRQFNGSILPEGQDRWWALLAMVVAGFAIFVVALYISSIVAHVPGANPTTLFIAGVLGLGASAGVGYLWPRVLGRARRPARPVRG